MLLAGLGIFGTMSYTVAQQQRELAIRAALGAGPADLGRFVLRAVLAITSIGLAAGMAIALAATRTLESFLFGIAPFDPLTYGTGGWRLSF